MSLTVKQQQNLKVILAIRARLSRGYVSRLATRMGYSRQNLHKHLNPANANTANLTELARISEELEKMIEEEKTAASKIIESIN